MKESPSREPDVRGRASDPEFYQMPPLSLDPSGVLYGVSYHHTLNAIRPPVTCRLSTYIKRGSTPKATIWKSAFGWPPPWPRRGLFDGRHRPWFSPGLVRQGREHVIRGSSPRGFRIVGVVSALSSAFLTSARASDASAGRITVLSDGATFRDLPMAHALLPHPSPRPRPAAHGSAVLAFLRRLVAIVAHLSRDIASRTAPGQSPAASVRGTLARPALAFTTGC